MENVAEELKIDELNDDEVRASLVVAAERQAIPSCDILTVWKEFKHPRHEEFAEPTRWSLLNAFTETAKKYSPARADQCYRSLTRLFGLDGTPAELWKYSTALCPGTPSVGSGANDRVPRTPAASVAGFIN